MDIEQGKNQDTLTVLTTPSGQAMGWGDSLKPTEIQVSTIQTNLKVFTEKISKILEGVGSVKNYSLEEVTINVSVAAKGEIQLISIVRGGGQMESGISLKFKRVA